VFDLLNGYMVFYAPENMTLVDKDDNTKMESEGFTYKLVSFVPNKTKFRISYDKRCIDFTFPCLCGTGFIVQFNLDDIGDRGEIIKFCVHDSLLDLRFSLFVVN